MAEHLTDAVLRALIAGALADEALLEADEHLAACAACRARAAAQGDSSEADAVVAALAEADEHLTDAEVQAYATSRVGPGEMAGLEQHLQACEACAAEVRELASWIAPPAPSTPSTARPSPAQGRSFSWLAVAAALLLAAAIPLAMWFGSTGRPADASAEMEAIALLAPTQRARVRTLLQDAAPAQPSVLEALRGHDEVQLGPAAPEATFSVVSPVGTAVRAAAPTFRWQPLPNAASYQVSVYDERGNPVVLSPSTADTAWTAPGTLPSGVVLVWQVTATTADGRRTVTPAAPAPPARFVVVPSETLDGLVRLEREHPEAHLAIGLTAFDAGLVDDARHHLSLVPSTSAGSRRAQQLLDRLSPPSTDASGKAR